MDRPHTILIVEDDTRMLRLMQRNLELAHYHVLTAVDGPAGWEAYTSGRPDLVITGLMMPGFSGLEFIRRIRENDKTTKILVATAANSPASRDEALTLGADVYLNKRFGGRELLVIVRDLLSRS